MRLVRTLVIAGATVATIGTVVGTILPSDNNTAPKAETHQQHSWAEYEKQRLRDGNGRLPRVPEASSGPGAADSASATGPADAKKGVTAAADRSGADNVAGGLVDALVKH